MRRSGDDRRLRRIYSRVWHVKEIRDQQNKRQQVIKSNVIGSLMLSSVKGTFNPHMASELHKTTLHSPVQMEKFYWVLYLKPDTMLTYINLSHIVSSQVTGSTFYQ